MKRLAGVSIVIPNHNYGRFVGRAIQSALDQDHPELEVIVVDDGSSDDSRAVITGFGARIRAIYQANAGHVTACTVGWKLAQHEIVIFLDSDDLLMPRAASTIAAAWRPGVSKVQWTLQVIDEAGRPGPYSYPKYPKSLSPGAVRAALLSSGGYPCPPTSGNAYARWFLEALLSIDGLEWMDPVLTSAAPLYGDVLTIDLPLGAYRCHAANDSGQSAISLERFEQYVQKEERRLAFLARCCRDLKIPFELETAKSRDLWYQEARLMAAKLGGGWSGGAAGRTILAIAGSPQSAWQRLIRASWVALVALLPAAPARRLIELRYVPVRRPRVFETLIRGVRRARPRLAPGLGPAR